MAKGFMTQKSQRKERDVMFQDGVGMAWATANKPGANPVNRSRSRILGIRLAGVYDKYRNDQLRYNPRFKLGRSTKAAPQNANPQKRESLSERTRGLEGNRAYRRAAHR